MPGSSTAWPATSTWIIARECVEKYGDLKKWESVVGTGPWMLERYEPGARLSFVRNPNCFYPGLPYVDVGGAHDQPRSERGLSRRSWPESWTSARSTA